MSSRGRRVEADPQTMTRNDSVAVRTKRSNVSQVRSLLAVKDERCAVLIAAQMHALPRVRDFAD